MSSNVSILQPKSFLFRRQYSFHTKGEVIFMEKKKPFEIMDNDLATENLENDFDMTAADLQDLEH